MVATTGKSHFSSLLWAIDGATGTILPGYPLMLPEEAAISAPVLLLDLHDYYRFTCVFFSSRLDSYLVSCSDGHYKLSPSKYADPSLPAWLQLHRGHEPAPAPR